MSDKQIIAKLKKLGKATVQDLGTDNPTIKALEKKGLVFRAGHVSTGKRGRPPILWTTDQSEAAAYEKEQQEKREAALNESEPNKPQKKSEESIQARLDKAHAEVRTHPRYRGCTCVRQLQSVSPQILRGYQGCQDRWICKALDDLRRAM